MMSQDLEVMCTKVQDTAVQTVKEGNASLRGGLRFFSPLLTAVMLCALAGGPASAQQGPSQASQAQAATPATPVASQHATAPLVTFENGQLTIVAENVSLAEVMAAIHNAMGTQVEIPPGSSTDRVWAHLGPGSAHRILSDLLANTELDYIIQGSPSDNGGIRSVTLSVRAPDSGPGKNGAMSSPIESAAERRNPRFGSIPASASEPQPEAAPAPAPTPQEAASAATVTPAAPAAPAATPAADGSSSDSASAPVAPSTDGTPKLAEQASASMTPTGPPNVFPQTPQPSAGSFNPHPSPPPSMSTDQVVQQLANMYQQRRQMQTGQASSTPN
jgi:hypothetical protein